MAMTPVTMNYGENKCDYASELRRMLDLVGGYDAPIYHSQAQFVNGVPSGVLCQLTLTLQAHPDGRPREPLYFHSRRTSLVDAVEETARIAMLRLARVHTADLAGTAYRLHPAGSHMDLSPLQRDLDEDDDEIVTQLASLAFDQARHAERTATELHHVYQELDAALERIALQEDNVHVPDEADDPELGVEVPVYHGEEDADEDAEAVVPRAPNGPASPIIPALVQFQLGLFGPATSTSSVAEYTP